MIFRVCPSHRGLFHSHIVGQLKRGHSGSIKLLVLDYYQVQYKPRLRKEVAALDGFRLEWDDVMEVEQLIMSQRVCRTTIDHQIITDRHLPPPPPTHPTLSYDLRIGSL